MFSRKAHSQRGSADSSTDTPPTHAHHMRIALLPMPDQRYDAGRQTIGALLSTTSPQIEVPEWQRSYSWDTRRSRPSGSDLAAFGDQYPDDNITGQEYFLGSIVLVTGGTPTCCSTASSGSRPRQFCCRCLRDDAPHAQGGRCHPPPEQVHLGLRRCDEETTYVLTLNNYDRDFFRGGDPGRAGKPARTAPTPSLKSHGLIRKAREYFEERCRRTSRASSAEARRRSSGTSASRARCSCDHMSLVAVTSTDEDNAAAVFETLNDRGIGLSTPDLLRNLLLRRAPDEDRARADRGRLANGPRASTTRPASRSSSATTGSATAATSRPASSTARSRTRSSTEDIDSLAFSRDLAETAPLYRDIVRAREDDPELQQAIWPAFACSAPRRCTRSLLSGYAATGEDGDKTKLRELAHALIAMFVRYNVIGGRETTVMETTVYGVAAKLRNDKEFDAAIAALAALAPDAKDFVERFKRASISRIATARYLLREIEHAKRRRRRSSRAAPTACTSSTSTPDARTREVAQPRRGDQPPRQPDAARQAAQHRDQERRLRHQEGEGLRRLGHPDDEGADGPGHLGRSRGRRASASS